MKKLMLLLLMVSPLLYQSCSKSGVNEVAEDCGCNLKPDKNVTASIGSIESVFDFYIGQSSNNKNMHYALALNSEEFKSDDLKALLQSYELDNVPARDIVNLVFFTNHKINAADKYVVAKEDIKGVLVYLEQQGQLYTEVYQFSDNNFTRIDDLSSEIKLISSNDYFTCSYVFKEYDTEATVIYSLFSDKKIIYPESGKDFALILKSYLLNSSSSFKNTAIMDKTYEEPPCKFPCPEGEGRCAVRQSADGHEVWYCSCVGGIVEEKVEENDEIYIVNHDRLYAFRDSFLENSTKGQEYISNYYMIGTYIESDDISFDLAWDAMNIAYNEVLPIIDKLMYTSSSTAILYDSTTTTQLLYLTNEVKSLSSDSVFVSIMNSVASDVQYYENKKVFEVVADFQ